MPLELFRRPSKNNQKNWNISNFSAAKLYTVCAKIRHMKIMCEKRCIFVDTTINSSDEDKTFRKES